MSNVDERIEALPVWARTPVREWIEQGRSEEQIHGVLNFFTGRGLRLLPDLLQDITEAVPKALSANKDTGDPLEENSYDFFKLAIDVTHEALDRVRKEWGL